MKKIILLLSAILIVACSNSGSGSSGSSAGKSPKPDNPQGCPVVISGSETNLEIALAFHQWRTASNSSDSDLQTAIACAFPEN